MLPNLFQSSTSLPVILISSVLLLPERKTQGSYLLSVHLIYRKGRGPRHAKAGLKLLLGCPATAPICLQAPLPHLGGAEAGQQAYCLPHYLPEMHGQYLLRDSHSVFLETSRLVSG